MVSDKSPCILTPLRRQSHAENNKHRAIYLYPARARRFVRRGSQCGQTGPYLAPKVAAVNNETRTSCCRNPPFLSQQCSQFGFSLTVLTGKLSEVSETPATPRHHQTFYPSPIPA